MGFAHHCMRENMGLEAKDQVGLTLMGYKGAIFRVKRRGGEERKGKGHKAETNQNTGRSKQKTEQE